MKLVAAAVALVVSAGSASALCHPTKNGGFSCVDAEADRLDELNPPKRKVQADDDDRSDYGRQRYYSDGTTGYSLGNGREWKERYRGDRQGITSYRY